MRMHSTARQIMMMVSAVLVVTSLGCSHVNRAERQAEREVYVISDDANGVGSNVNGGTGGAGAEAYCNELEKTCYKQCWRRKPELSSIPKGSGKHNEFCNEKCRKEFNECVEKLEQAERQELQSRFPARKQEFHFPDTGTALVWLKEHKTEVALGALVIVGGVLAAPAVAYVIGLSATGALVLLAVPAM
jgi:hypothetical protein